MAGLFLACQGAVVLLSRSCFGALNTADDVVAHKWTHGVSHYSALVKILNTTDQLTSCTLLLWGAAAPRINRAADCLRVRYSEG